VAELAHEARKERHNPEIAACISFNPLRTSGTGQQRGMASHHDRVNSIKTMHNCYA
jgi:hypothetical protein